MQYPRIQTVSVLDDFTLIVEFTNQAIKKYDIRRLLDIPMFYPLRQPAFFRNFKIEEGGYAIVWNEEIDISEYELWQNSVAWQTDESVGKPINQTSSTTSSRH